MAMVRARRHLRQRKASLHLLGRQVLEYFDAYLISLTATPSKQTIGFFNKNLVKEDEPERPSPTRSKSTTTVYKIDTEITKCGSRVEKSFYVDNTTASPTKSAVNNSTRSGLRA
jgi:type I site-specific restriction endonuclease